MRIRRKRKYDDPLCHGDHRRPRTRREFLSQGFILGTGAVLGGASIVTPSGAHAVLSPDLAQLFDGLGGDDLQNCNIRANGAGKIPFIAFDLAGGSNQGRF